MLRQLLQRVFGQRRANAPSREEKLADVGDVVGYSSSGTKFVIDSVTPEGTQAVATAEDDASGVCTLHPIPEPHVTFDGKLVVLSGKHSIPRDQLVERLQRAGARVTKQVSKRTDFVVNGDPIGFYLEDGTFKPYRWRSGTMEKAEALGTHILDETGLIELLNRSEANVAGDNGPV